MVSLPPNARPLTEVPAAGSIVLATELRGTVLTTSLAFAHERGLGDAYFERLPSELHATIGDISPLSWVGADVALAHYRVMDELFPTPAEQVANGHASSERTQNAYLRTVFRFAQAAGQLDPSVALRRLPAAFGRMWKGGGAPVAYSTGPKDARVELFAYPILSVDYVRNGWQGMLESGLSLTARRVYVRLDAHFAGQHNAAYDISWV